MDERLQPGKRRDRAAKAAAARRSRVPSGPRSRHSQAQGPESRGAELVGALFRSARELLGITQHEVADLTTGAGSISRAAISDIERGRSLPGLEAMVTLCQVLHVDPLEVLERIDLSRTTPVDLTGVSFDDLRKRAEELYWSGDYREALTVCDAMADLLSLSPPTDEGERRRRQARIEIDRADIQLRCSALKASKASAERATVLAEGVPDLQAEAYRALASLHSHEGIVTLARDAAERAIELSRRGSAKLQSSTWSLMGNVLHRARQFEKAHEAFLKAREFAVHAQDHHNLIKVEGNIGACLMDLGRRSTARKQFVKAIDLARKHADPPAEAFWLIELGRLVLADGELDEADRYANAALKIAKPREQFLTIFRATWLQHHVARRRAPDDSDRHRLAYLKRLYTRVKNHRSIDVIQEFKQTVLDPAIGRGGTHGSSNG